MMLNCWEMDPDNRPTFKVLVADISQNLTCMADYLTLSQEDPVASERSSFTMENHTHHGDEYYLEDGHGSIDVKGEERGHKERENTRLNASARYVEVVETSRDKMTESDNKEEMNCAESSLVDNNGYLLAQALEPPVD